jgi:hypothetical protein
MAMLSRLILYSPDGKRATMLVDGLDFDGKILKFTDRKTRVHTVTTLPFVIQELEEERVADISYP